jgi:threonine synthase
MASAIRIGDPVSYPRARAALAATNGLVTACSETEITDAMTLLDRQGLFACPQTAAACAGTRQLMRAGTIRRTATTVVVSTASGLKFTDSKAGVAPASVRVSADISAVRGALREVLS